MKRHSEPTITEAMDPDELIDSGAMSTLGHKRGVITCLEYCEREVERMRSMGDRRVRLRKKYGKVGVTR